MTDQEEQEWKDRLAEEFKAELRELMKKHGVDRILAEDHWQGYPECGEDVRMTVEITSLWEEGEPKRPWVEIDLGSEFYAEP